MSFNNPLHIRNTISNNAIIPFFLKKDVEQRCVLKQWQALNCLTLFELCQYNPLFFIWTPENENIPNLILQLQVSLAWSLCGTGRLSLRLESSLLYFKRSSRKPLSHTNMSRDIFLHKT